MDMDIFSCIFGAAAQGGIFQHILVYAAVISPAVSLLIEIMEAVVKLTPDKEDDKLVSKFKACWSKVKPFFEVLPHSRIRFWKMARPVVAFFVKALEVFRQLKQLKKGKDENTK